MSQGLDELLTTAASHRQWRQRRDALAELDKTAQPFPAAVFIAALSDRARRVRRLAARVLIRRLQADEPGLHDQLRARLGEDATAAAPAAVVLVSTVAGRAALAALPDTGLAVLTHALALPSLTNYNAKQLLRALWVVQNRAVHRLIRPLLTDPSQSVREAAELTLNICRDRLDGELLLDPQLSPPLVAVEVQWLGEHGGLRAIPILQALCGWRSIFRVSREMRAAARIALDQAVASTAHIPDAALTVASPPPNEPDPRSLALWDEDDDAPDADDGD